MGAIKKTFIAKVSRSAALPKGCLVVNNKVQYNALNGKANKNAQPVCVQVTGGKKTTPKKGGGKKTTPKKKPTKKLVMAAKGKANCAGKGTPVKDIKGCQAAAKALKKQFGSSSVKGYTAYPKGCFFVNNKFFFNAGKTGAGNKAAQAVCVATASATKKPTKK